MAVFDSRRARKRYDRLTARLGGNAQPIRRFGPLYWAPRRLSWITGALFMIGSACFAIGPVVAITNQEAPAGIIFFVGSIFFTSAAYTQYLEVVNSGGERGGGGLRALALEPRRIEWWSCSVQLLGTLYFNFSTFAAMIHGLDAVHQDRLSWRPDVFGSICFLIASYLAYYEVCRRWVCWRNRGIGWWIAVANMLGSIAFGISAIGAYVIHGTGDIYNAAASNGGTFAGALFFFAGAYLLWPEAKRASTATS